MLPPSVTGGYRIEMTQKELERVWSRCLCPECWLVKVGRSAVLEIAGFALCDGEGCCFKKCKRMALGTDFRVEVKNRMQRSLFGLNDCHYRILSQYPLQKKHDGIGAIQL